MPTSWPKERRIIGTKVPRLDGPDKSTGRAKYSFDINRPGMLQAMILRCPHTHAKVVSIDSAEAEKMPGVKAVHVIAGPGKELFYAGDEVIALAADTEEHAHDALRAIKVKYEVLDFVVLEEDALKKDPKTAPPLGPKQERENVRPAQEQTKGDVEQGFKEAEVIHEATYGVPVICHQCLESHGLVAEWSKLETQDPELTVWCSTQAVAGTAGALAANFKARYPKLQVKCITHYMGGGYGSKFGPDIQGFVACELALKAKAPVKLMLDREDEVTCGGNRPSAYARVKIGAKKDGTITAFEVDSHGTPGVGNAASVNINLLPYVYMDAVPNYKRRAVIVRTNGGSVRAMRAPGHPQNCVLTDCPLDDLVAKIRPDMDPMEVRIKNLPPNTGPADSSQFNTIRNTVYRTEIEIAAKLSDWKKKWHPPGKGPGTGVLRHGIGMAIHTWGGNAAGNNDVTVIITRDGSVTTQTSSQDLGTGQKTLNAIVAAEILGLKPEDIIAKLGESQWGQSSGSGGSTTAPSQAPATLIAATNARTDLFAKIAPKLGAKPDDLEIQVGKVVDKASKKSWSWKEACAALGMNEAKATGTWSQAEAIKPENKGVSNGQVGGVQIAEVMVDIETGVVKCTHVVAVQDCGMIINKQGCESQVTGGVIMGVNYALFEERIMDRVTGRQCNPNMEFYKLGGIEDMPKVTVHMHDMPERGVIGIGEPPTISTCAAVGNAVFNAIGVRVANAPYTPARVLAALAGKKA
jgi:xanthine dehydrogenase YagR molybdenum-binding subunit